MTVQQRAGELRLLPSPVAGSSVLPVLDPALFDRSVDRFDADEDGLLSTVPAAAVRRGAASPAAPS